jgi:catechol-2,3-dioxygenase
MTATDTASTTATDTVPSITGVHHVVVTVRDLEASASWYERVVGLARVMEGEHEGVHLTVLMHPQSTLLIGVQTHDANPGESFSETRTGLDHISFGVTTHAELEAWEARFNHLGVTHSPIADTPYGSILVFRDPDHIQRELIVWSAS